jgi:hypothetical protein
MPAFRHDCPKLGIIFLQFLAEFHISSYNARCFAIVRRRTMFAGKLRIAVTLCCFALILTMPVVKARSTRANAATTITAQSAPDFIFTMDRSNVKLKRGTGFLVTRTIQAVNGFNGTVTFTLSGNLPVGVHVTGDDGPVTGSGSSAFDLQSDKHNFVLNQPATCTVTATSGNISHSANLTITII